jgi:hypothetical protein
MGTRDAAHLFHQLLTQDTSAIFHEHAHEYVGNGAWIFKGDVDSQNKFGALLTSPYECGINITIRKVRVGDKVFLYEPMF